MTSTQQLFRSLLASLVLLVLLAQYNAFSQGFEGYYRYPDIHENKVVFSAEGDLWTVDLSGGLAQRLTTHDEDETFPAISPDGKTIAFSASYEGPTEVYTMPITGGLPFRWTYEGDASITSDWYIPSSDPANVIVPFASAGAKVTSCDKILA